MRITYIVTLPGVDFLLRKFKYVLNYFSYAYLKVQKSLHFKESTPPVMVISISALFNECLIGFDSQALKIQTQKGNIFDFSKPYIGKNGSFLSHHSVRKKKKQPRQPKNQQQKNQENPQTHSHQTFTQKKVFTNIVSNSLSFVRVTSGNPFRF